MGGVTVGVNRVVEGKNTFYEGVPDSDAVVKEIKDLSRDLWGDHSRSIDRQLDDGHRLPAPQEATDPANHDLASDNSTDEHRVESLSTGLEDTSSPPKLHAENGGNVNEFRIQGARRQPANQHMKILTRNWRVICPPWKAQFSAANTQKQHKVFPEFTTLTLYSYMRFKGFGISDHSLAYWTPRSMTRVKATSLSRALLP